MRSLLALFVSLVVVIASGCGTDTNVTVSTASGADLNPDTTDAGKSPGALYSATTLPTLDRRLKSNTSLAARMSYTSTSGITGELTEVTGVVFVPDGTPPPGGWPVVVYAHATTGISAECAPSMSLDLLGTSAEIEIFLEAGYLVVAPDYQGLGLDRTYHPYADSTSAGYNVIDSVRAARHLVSDASDRWVPVGHSQGGQAAWAANELATSYGSGLALLGSVSVAPATDLTSYVSAAEAGTLTREQLATLQLILVALKAEHPELDLDDYRRGVVEENWSLLSSCLPSDSADRAAAIAKITADDLRPRTPEAAATLRGYLSDMGLPKTRAAAPMLVVYGGKDAFQPVSWADGALAKACVMGDVIDMQFDPNQGHNDVEVSAMIRWVNDRFRSAPVQNGCDTFRPQTS